VVRRHGCRIEGRRKDELPDGALDRCKELWANRIAAAQDEAHPERLLPELLEFGHWVENSPLPIEWVLEMLHKTLRLTGGSIENYYQVLKTLAEEVTGHTLLVLRCASAITKPAGPGWIQHPTEPQWEAILCEGLRSTDAEARDLARQVINRFGEIGENRFKPLLELANA